MTIRRNYLRRELYPKKIRRKSSKKKKLTSSLTSWSPSSPFWSSSSFFLLSSFSSGAFKAGKLFHLCVCVEFGSSSSSCLCRDATFRMTSTLKTMSSKAACCRSGGFRPVLTKGLKEGVDHARGNLPERKPPKTKINERRSRTKNETYRLDSDSFRCRQCWRTSGGLFGNLR